MNSAKTTTASASADPAQVAAVKRTDLEVPASSVYDGRRAPKSKDSSGTILGIFLALLLLGAIGGGGYYYCITYVDAPKTSAPRLSGSLRSSQLAAPSSKPEAPGTEASGSRQAISLQVSRHSRTLVATVSAVLLAAVLIATTVVLAKALNAPPQVIENNTFSPNPVPAANCMPPGGIAGIVLGTVFFVAFIVVCIVLKRRDSGATQSLRELGLKMVALNSKDPEALKRHITQVFDDISNHIKDQNGLWQPHFVQVDGAVPNMGVCSVADSFNRPNVFDSHMEIVNGWLPWEYYYNMIRCRANLPANIVATKFVLIVGTSGHLDALLNANDVVDPATARFRVVSIEGQGIATDQIGPLGRVLGLLMQYRTFIKANPPPRHPQQGCFDGIRAKLACAG